MKHKTLIFKSKAFTALILIIAVLIGHGLKPVWFNLAFISDANADVATSEMQSVINYMSNKLRIPAAPKGTTCVGGTVTGIGCDSTTCNVTTANVTQSSVSQGSGTLTCSVGYTGSPTYTCNSGTFTQTGGSCTAITCPVSVTGISSPSSVAYTATSKSLTCNSAGYSGTVNYTCTSGTLNVISSCTCTGIIYSSICYNLVGSYSLGEAPYWTTNPPTKTCQEACQMKFGGVLANYRCSTTSSSINAQAAINQSYIGCFVQSDNIKSCINYNDATGCVSAWVSGNVYCDSVSNYCFYY